VELEPGFEWDTEKEAINEIKHGVTFVGSAQVFADPYRIEQDATRPEHGERRIKVIGRVGSVILVVIYTNRQGRRRIISARRASKHEREQYREGPQTP
jgi:uncharacterized DUF497 family protein